MVESSDYSSHGDRLSGARTAFLIVIHGSNVGRMYKFTSDDIVIGTNSSAQIHIEDEGVSELHALLHRQPDGSVIISALQPPNGTMVNGEPVSTHVLQDGDKIQVGARAILKFSHQDDIEETYHRQIYESATKDGLTRIPNRRFLMDRAASEFAFAVRHHETMSLLILDIDHFKQINDAFGHPAGDAVLRELALIVSKVVRTEDAFARYGGEEFAILARGIDADAVLVLAERVRRTVANHIFAYEGNAISVTVSVGAATLANGNFHTVEDLFQAADQYLYKAKQSGRNRVECELAQWAHRL